MIHKWPDYVSNFSDFTENEAKLLDEHFDFYWALYNEDREAKTDLQKQFIINCAAGSPVTRHEHAFYKFLVGSGNVESCSDEDYEPISDQDFINKLKTVVADEGLLDFYTNNHWDEYVESRYNFTVDEAYILDLESGYLAAVYDEVIEAPDDSVSVLVENCYNEAPQSLREKTFYKFLEHATFPEYVEELETTECQKEENEPEETAIKETDERVKDAADERPGSGYLTPVEIDTPTKITKPVYTPPPTKRGAASIDEILGGNDGKPLRTPEETIILGVFGSRKAWNRMRGRRNRYGK